MTAIAPITKLADLDGLPLTPASRLPHPCLLSRWEGLYEIDTVSSRFRLTAAGRRAA